MITKVTFKVETFDGTHPAGPVTLIDEGLYRTDPIVIRGFIPYGYTPQGVTTLEPWRTRQEALAIAAEHGVQLTEEGW